LNLQSAALDDAAPDPTADPHPRDRPWLTEAIHKVIAGETWIDQRCVQGLVKAIETEGRRSRKNQLSEREREVLKGVFTGLSNKEIGNQLTISEASVKSALQQLFIKTGVRTRSQLVRVALEEYGTTWGLITRQASER
jgi:DNA-binding NarL/FixJ family response regulator